MLDFLMRGRSFLEAPDIRITVGWGDFTHATGAG